MFVQEEKIFAAKVLRLRICALDGAEWLEEVAEDTAIERLKERCLKHCVPGSLEDPKSVTHHKLIHAASEKVLNDTKTVSEENIQDRVFQAVAALMEMGFDEKEVVDALRVNNNQQNAACEWLLGERKPTPEDLDKGIDPASPLFQAILENPVVQLGLTNPKTLLAFEDMLENPLNSTQWMNDPETGPVMLQISRIFQTLNRT
ncbi:ubiquitin-associated domain-containing protein 1-like [Notechis scutatus]|uniref:Ubiquitin-associated domain-containing protein 1 n=1 Tax=Notechis scutatus TaxID=8663 RepID=A0A6J1VFN1_9SAUR|nr:ubiquitin-associated domain-containing protein 1-like [Notechis scutatus]